MRCYACKYETFNRNNKFTESDLMLILFKDKIEYCNTVYVCPQCGTLKIEEISKQ